MENMIVPKSENADICLILEGTYPFVQGGVSNWVYELIKIFPEYTFAVVFMGTREEDYHGLVYPLPENVVHLEICYLFEQTLHVSHSTEGIDPEVMKKIESMHDKFKKYTTDHTVEIPEIFDLLLNDDQVNRTQFMRSRQAWDFIEKKYTDNYPQQSFFDYFWSIRSLHTPFWYFGKIVDRIPRVKVLHSASTGYAGFLGALLQKKYGNPYILTEHGIYSNERWIEIMRNYFFEKATQKGKNSDSGLSLATMLIEFFKIIAKIAYGCSNPIISLFEECRQYQIRDGALADRTRIISYGIDFHRYTFLAKEKPDQEKPVIAFIGRLVPIKDLKTYIRTMALVIKQKPAAEGWIIGPEKEDPAYVSACKSLVEYFGLQEKIKFLGYQNVMEIYPKIDMVALSSISEGTPFAILESFAVGIPVVATAVGGCGELIFGKNEEDKKLGAAGKLVNIADPDAMAKAVIELLNETEWQSAQKVGYERVRKFYSMEQLKHNYGEIYKEAMSSWQG